MAQKGLSSTFETDNKPLFKMPAQYFGIEALAMAKWHNKTFLFIEVDHNGVDDGVRSLEPRYADTYITALKRGSFKRRQFTCFV